MESTARRLVLDRAFSEVLNNVLETFIREGFSVRSLDGGNLRRGPRSSSASRRYVQLDVTLPELDSSCAALHVDDSALVGCRLTLFELAHSCTLLTAENPTRRFAVLSTLAPAVEEHMGRALDFVARAHESINAA